MSSIQPTTPKVKQAKVQPYNAIRWEEGPFSVRFQGKRYVVNYRVGGKGAPKLMDRFHHVEQAIEHGQALHKRWQAGDVMESLKEREVRIKDEITVGRESTVPVFAYGYGYAGEADTLLTEDEARKKYPWSISLFTFIDCNSVAVIWQCTKLRGPQGPGRKSPTGNHQEPVTHTPGDFAVTYLQFGLTATEDSVRDDHGRPKVFGTIGEAYAEADRRFDIAPEEDRFVTAVSGTGFSKYVTSYANLDIYADVANNGYRQPFYIWINLPFGRGKKLNKESVIDSTWTFSTLSGAYNKAISVFNHYFKEQYKL